MEGSKYLINVNGVHQFELDAEQLSGLDLVKTAADRFHVLHDQSAFRAELIEADYKEKTFKVKINGNLYTISIADQYDQLVEKMGLAAVASNKVKDIKAPMPGLVLDINVAAGQEVNKGDKLVILEAMKMENVIKSVGIGVVKEIHVEKGATVDKGQLLIEMG